MDAALGLTPSLSLTLKAFAIDYMLDKISFSPSSSVSVTHAGSKVGSFLLSCLTHSYRNPQPMALFPTTYRSDYIQPARKEVSKNDALETIISLELETHRQLSQDWLAMEDFPITRPFFETNEADPVFDKLSLKGIICQIFSYHLPLYTFRAHSILFSSPPSQNLFSASV